MSIEYVGPDWKTNPPECTPTFFSFRMDMPTRSPLVTDDNFPLITRNVSVEATMRAAEEETPDPAGISLVNNASIPTGMSLAPAGKYFSKTP
jgi:hypothetical protein